MDDHDLLIRVDQKVEGLIATIKELSDNTLGRLQAVENEKADREELRNIAETFSKGLDAEKAERRASEADTENRMRSVERFVYVAMGIAVIAQLVILPVVLKFFLKQ